MTGVHHSILCFPLSLLEAEEANRAAALCSWEGEGSTLLLPTVNEFRINEWVSEWFFFSMHRDVFPNEPMGGWLIHHPVSRSRISALSLASGASFSKRLIACFERCNE